MLMTRKYSKPYIVIWKLKRLLRQRSRSRIDKCYEEVEMRQNHEKYKAMVLEKTTGNPGVESDNTVIALENKI